MDFRELMRIASENKQRAVKECKENKRYTTKLPPPKKELKIVDANAIKNRLKTKEQLLKEKVAEEARKKEELLRLRAAAQAGKKGKGSKKDAKEFKSSLTTSTTEKNVYQPDRTQYDDDDHRNRHKNFMQTVDKVAKKNVEDWFDSSESEEEEERAPVKKKPQSAKKIKGPMSFEEIMKLAAENKKSGGPVPDPSQNLNGASSSKTGTFNISFNKNQRDRKEKPPEVGKAGVNLKAAAEKYKSTGVKTESQKPDSSDKHEHDDEYDEDDDEPDEHVKPVSTNGRLHKSSDEKHKRKSSRAEVINGAHKQSQERRAIKQSNNSRKTIKSGQPNRSDKPLVASKVASDLHRSKGNPARLDKPSTSSSSLKAKPTQSKSTEHMRVKSKVDLAKEELKNLKSKVDLAKEELKNVKGKVDLKQKELKNSQRFSKETPKKAGKPVANGKDRQWMDVMARDRDRARARPSPKQQHRERPSDRPMTAEQSRRAALKRAAESLPRMKVKHGRLMSDDESDYEEDGFIDDSPLDAGNGGDVSSYIKEIFGYDKTKYKPESDYALRQMDASYKDIQKEEARSARLGMLEDLEDMRKEKEEEQRKKLKKKAGSKKGKR